MRLIHTGDLHLDAPFAYLDYERRVLKQQALRQALVEAVDLTLENQAELLIVAGDLFNTPNPLLDTINFAQAQLARLTDRAAVAIVPGNHDYYLSGGVWDREDWPAGVKIFKAGDWEVISLPDRAAFSIAGIACQRTGSEQNALKRLGVEAGVAVMHGAHVLDFYEGEHSFPFSETDAAAAAAGYLALGHHHNFARVGKSSAYYCGTPEGLCFDEIGERSFSLVTIDTGGVKVDRLPAGRYVYERRRLDCTSFSTTAEIENAAAEFAGNERMLKLELTGAPGLELEIDVEAMRLRLAARFFFLDIKHRLELPDPGSADDKTQGTVRAIFLERMREKLTGAQDDSERQAVNLATRLGLAALQGRLKG